MVNLLYFLAGYLSAILGFGIYIRARTDGTLKLKHDSKGCYFLMSISKNPNQLKSNSVMFIRVLDDENNSQDI